MPQVVAWLPTEGLEERSQKYIVKESVGNGWLSPVMAALLPCGVAMRV